jgi:hypothetical protein
MRLFLLVLVICSLGLQVGELHANPKKEIEEKNYSQCALHPKAVKLAELIMRDSEQKRVKLTCHPILAKVAAEKAKEMAELQRVTHIGKRGANIRLRDAGYQLAQIYPGMMSNNVEAIAGGIPSPEKMWEEFKGSKGHRVHLLAEHEFYLLQDEIGVGYFYDWHTPHVDYWVVYVAHQKPSLIKVEVAPSKD